MNQVYVMGKENSDILLIDHPCLLLLPEHASNKNNCRNSMYLISFKADIESYLNVDQLSIKSIKRVSDRSFIRENINQTASDTLYYWKKPGLL